MGLSARRERGILSLLLVVLLLVLVLPFAPEESLYRFACIERRAGKRDYLEGRGRMSE